MTDTTIGNASLITQLLETTQEGFWYVDTETKTIDVNPAMCRILGMERAAIIGRSIYDFVDEDNRQIFLAEIDARKRGKTGAYEIALRRSDGTNIPCISNASPIFGDDGERVGSIGLWTDISQTKNYRNLIEGSNQGIAILAQDSTILFANDACASIFGYDDGAALVSRKFSEDLVASVDIGRVLAVRAEHFEGGRASEILEYTALTRTGATVHLQEILQRTEWNGAPAVESKLVDVTERYGAERALRASEERLRAIIDHSPAAIMLKDLQGRYQISNRSYAAWLDRTPEEVIGKTPREVYPADTAERGELQDHSIVQTGKALEWEAELPLPGDIVRTVQFNKFPVYGADDDIIGIGVIGTDVTRQKESEALLNESEQRFRDFAESAADWFWEMDADLRFTYISPGLERAHGIPAKWYYGKTREELLGPEIDLDAWCAHLDTLNKREPFRDFTYRRYGDGLEPQWVRTSGRPIHDSKGNFQGYRGTGTDVSTFMQREVALQESERNLREILERSPIGVAIVKFTVAGGKLAVERQFINDALVAMFGQATQEAMIALDHSQTWVYPDQRETFEKAIVAGEDLIDFQCRRRRHDGSEWTVSLDTRPVLFDGRNCVMVWHHDITEREQALASLRENTALLRSVVDQMPAAISLKDTQGHYLMVNKQFEEIHGLMSGRVIGKTTAEIGFSPRSAERISALDREVVATGSIRTEEEPVETQSGTFDRSATKFPTFDATGKINGVGTVALDIAERKAMEEKLRQAQKMEAVGQLTGGLAHDFNNLLSIVIGNLDFLEETLGEHDDAKQLIDTALKAALQGADLTNRLLAFSRKQSLNPEVVNLNDLVFGIMDLLERTLGETITIRTVAPSEAAMVEIDTAQMESALLNLAVNARQAMPEGGRLTIETGHTILEKEYTDKHEGLEPGAYSMLVVSDTGMGMAPNVLAHVFEPFYTTKEVGQGSGLGLSMVFGFVKQSRGHIMIYSEPDAGTAVKLFFPSAGKQAISDRNADEDAAVPVGKGECVLIVEDDEDLRDLAAKSVTSLGYRVTTVADGPEALGILEGDETVDVLFTDVVLPKGMNGVALAKAARERRPGIRILFTSGYTQNAVFEDGLFDRPTLVEKPYRKAELAHRLRKIIESKPAPA